MIVTCKKCDTRYKMDDASFVKPKIKVRCAKCRHVFVASKPQSAEQPSSTSAQDAQSAAVKNTRPKKKSNCKVISICNQKGGVGKTTTCMNLAASLYRMKKRVLLIDFDIQANLSLLLGYQDAKSFFEAIHSSGDDLTAYIVKTVHNFWLLPSNSNMALLSKKFLPDENFEYMLRDQLRQIKQHFDYVLIDTPPSGDFYTLNALLASDMAVIPAQCEYLSIKGASHIEGMINVIKKKIDHDIDFRVLATMYDAGNTACKVVLNKIRGQYGEKVFKTIIEKDVMMQESQIAHKTALYYNNASRSGLQYLAVAKELIELKADRPSENEVTGYDEPVYATG